MILKVEGLEEAHQLMEVVEETLTMLAVVVDLTAVF